MTELAPIWRCCGCGEEAPDLIRRCECATGLAYDATDKNRIEPMANDGLFWNPVGAGTPLGAWLETKRAGESGTNVCMGRIPCIGDDVEWCEREYRSEITDQLIAGRTTVTHSTFLPPTHWRWPQAHGEKDQS